MGHEELRPKEHVEVFGRFQLVLEHEPEGGRPFGRWDEVVAAEETQGVENVGAFLVLEDDLLVHGNAWFPAGLANVDGLAKAESDARDMLPVGGALVLDVPQLE